MEVYNINPNIRYAREHDNFRGYSYISKCYDCRIFYIRGGKGYVMANGEMYNFAENYIMFFPPETEYRFVVNGNETIPVQVFNFDLSDKYFNDTAHLGTPSKENFDAGKVPHYEFPEEFSHIIVREDFFKINELLSECIGLFLVKSAYYKEITSSILKKSLLMLLIQEKSPQQNNRLITSVLDHISKNYADVSLSNKSIAEHFNYHPYYLNRLIKNYTGKTMRQYIIYYRLRVAKNMLLTTDYDINTVSWKVGFNSTSYFITTFHRHFGRTPYEYRQKNVLY